MVLEQTYLDIAVEIQEYKPDFGKKMWKIFSSGPKIRSFPCKISQFIHPRGVKNGLKHSCYCWMVLEQTYLDITVEIQEYRLDFGKKMLKIFSKNT